MDQKTIMKQIQKIEEKRIMQQKQWEKQIVIMNKARMTQEYNKNLCLLKRSGFYGIEYYNEIMKMKDRTSEQNIKSYTERLKDINKVRLEEVLDVNGEIFDEIRLKIIIERIKQTKDDLDRNTYICWLQLKVLYMIAKDQIDPTYQKLFPKIILEGFYGFNI
jgi:hypothetical protein